MQRGSASAIAVSKLLNLKKICSYSRYSQIETPDKKKKLSFLSCAKSSSQPLNNEVIERYKLRENV